MHRGQPPNDRARNVAAPPLHPPSPHCLLSSTSLRPLRCPGVGCSSCATPHPLPINSRVYPTDQIVQNCQSDLHTPVFSPRSGCFAAASGSGPFAVSPADFSTPAMLFTGPKPSQGLRRHFPWSLAAQSPPGSSTFPCWARVHCAEQR